MHMNYPKLHIAKLILFNAFLVGFILNLIFAGIFFLGQNTWLSWAGYFWHINDPDWLWKITVEWFSVAKFFLFYLLLIPAVAIHWTIKQLEKSK